MPRSSHKDKGFTLLELIVSIGIMLVISSVIISGQGRYTSGVSLRNVANDLGLSLRQAQIYGVSVKELAPGGGNFNVGYGIAFNTATPPSGDEQSFIFFADRNGNGIYDGTWDCPLGPTSECLDKTTLTSGNHVSDLCIIASGVETCEDISRLDISFVRPAIEARIYYNGGAMGASGAEVKLGSLDDRENSVTIFSTGQISVQ